MERPCPTERHSDERMIPLHPDVRDSKGVITFDCDPCHRRGHQSTLLVIQIGDLKDTDQTLAELAPDEDFRYVAVGIVEAERSSYRTVLGDDGLFYGVTRDGTHYAVDASVMESYWDVHESRLRWLSWDAEWPRDLDCHRCTHTPRISRKRLADLTYKAVKNGSLVAHI